MNRNRLDLAFQKKQTRQPALLYVSVSTGESNLVYVIWIKEMKLSWR